jgi:hypothetical protein
MRTFEVFYDGQYYKTKAKGGYLAAAKLGKQLDLPRDTTIMVLMKTGWEYYDYKGDGTAVILRGMKGGDHRG